MNKKILTISLVAVAAITASVAAALSIRSGAGQPLLRNRADDGEYAYDMIFDTDMEENATVELGTFDSENDNYPFTITGKTATGDFPLVSSVYDNSDPYYIEGSFIYITGSTVVDISSNGMVGATCTNNGDYLQFQIMFSFYDRVVFDESSSYAVFEFCDYSKGSAKTTYPTAEFAEWDSVTNTYYASYYLTTSYADNYVRLQKIHFEYLCD